MHRCIVCLSSNNNSLSQINCHSFEWQECNIQRILEKHLWWWYLKETPKGNITGICRHCWQELWTFHRFYLKVEKVHKEYELINFGATENCLLQDHVQAVTKKEYDEVLDFKEESLLMDENAKVYEHFKAEKSAEDERSFIANSDTECNQSFQHDLINTLNTKAKQKTRKCKSKKKSKSLKKGLRSGLLTNSSTKQDICKKNDDFLAQYEFKLTCEICTIRLNDFDNLKAHYREQHHITGYVLCCNRKFIRRSVLVDHLRVHQNPNHFKCLHCDKCLSNRTCYEKHILLHKQSPEKQEKTFSCDECGKSFQKKASYDRHLLLHIPDDQRKFQCDECDKKFAAYYLVQQHKAFTHLKKYVKICDICGKAFRERLYFMRHMDEHKGTPIAKWPCDLCGVELSSKYHLNRHKKLMHTEENLKQQQCPYCPKISPNMHSHQLHVRYAHTLERKHACQLCDKKFRRPLELREHLSTHTGEPLYTCPHCPKTFISSGNMHKHRKNSHPKEFEEARLKKFVAQHGKIIQNNQGVSTTTSTNVNKGLRTCNES